MLRPQKAGSRRSSRTLVTCRRRWMKVMKKCRGRPEQNHLSCHARGVVLCLGPDAESAIEQAGTALSQGNKVVVVAPGVEKLLADASKAGLPVAAVDGLLEPEALIQLNGYEAVTSVAEKPLLKQ